MQGAPAHRRLYLRDRDTRHTDAQRITISGIEHVHQVGTHGGRGVYHAVFLGEVPLDQLTITILHLYISLQGEITSTPSYGLIQSTRKVHLLTADEYLRHLGGVHCSHDDTCRELIATHHCLGIGNDIGIQGIDTDILQVDIRHQGMQDSSLGITHIVLELTQQCHGGYRRHRLEHILLPVLTHRHGILRNLRGKVGCYQFLLLIVRNHPQHRVAIVIDGVKQLLSTTTPWGKHHLRGSLKVFLVAYVTHITVFAISLPHNGFLQLFRQVIELVTHRLDLL